MEEVPPIQAQQQQLGPGGPQEDSGTTRLYQWHPLLLRAQCGDAEGVRQLLATKEVSSPDATEPGEDLTALLVATANDHVDVVRVLLEAKADADKGRDTGVSPVYTAAAYYSADAMALLLAAKANPNNPATDGTTPLYCAAARPGQGEIIRQLIEARCDIDLTVGMELNCTAPFVAAHEGHTDALQLLLAAKCEVNKPNLADRATALFVAAQNGHLQVVRDLLAAGADVDQARTSDGGTPVFIAAWKGDADMVRELVLARCDVHRRKTDSVGGQPLMYAVQNGNVEVLRVLIEAGADVDAVSGAEGCTPMCVFFCAAGCGMRAHAHGCTHKLNTYTHIHKITTRKLTRKLMCSRPTHARMHARQLRRHPDQPHAHPGRADPRQGGRGQGHR